MKKMVCLIMVVLMTFSMLTVLAEENVFWKQEKNVTAEKNENLTRIIADVMRELKLVFTSGTPAAKPISFADKFYNKIEHSIQCEYLRMPASSGVQFERHLYQALIDDRNYKDKTIHLRMYF